MFTRGDYDKWEAYGQAKTANVLFAVRLDELARRDRRPGVRAAPRRHPDPAAAPPAARGAGGDWAGSTTRATRSSTSRPPSRAPRPRSGPRPARSSTASAASTSRTARSPASRPTTSRASGRTRSTPSRPPGSGTSRPTSPASTPSDPSRPARPREWRRRPRVGVGPVVGCGAHGLLDRNCDPTRTRSPRRLRRRSGSASGSTGSTSSFTLGSGWAAASDDLGEEIGSCPLGDLPGFSAPVVDRARRAAAGGADRGGQDGGGADRAHPLLRGPRRRAGRARRPDRWSRRAPPPSC